MGPLFIIPPNNSSPTKLEQPDDHNNNNNNVSSPSSSSSQKDMSPSENNNNNKQTATIISHYYNSNKPQNNNNNSQLRKYVVLLQDCVAIKFMREDCDEILGKDDERGSSSESTVSGGGGGCTPSIPLQQLLTKNDSGEGVQLFKLFRSSNLKATWNPQTTSAIASLTYKGFITPSTILLTSPLKSALNTLRTAYSRRLLRNPPGYRIELLAEIDEIIAQPVQQGQFTPLSDSLCWAIVELRASGKEAFVDSIVGALGGAFPGVSGPPKELVYRTLEKLIRERRVYQSSSGYHVVGPEVSEYMEAVMVGCSGGCSSDYFHDLLESNPPMNIPTTPIFREHDLRRPTRPTTTEQNRTNTLLKRHNSLKMIRQQQDLINPQPTNHNHQPSMGARSLSFRLSKVNSLFDSDKEDEEDDEEDILGRDYYYGDEEYAEEWRGRERVVSDTPDSTVVVTKKPRSFFRRWFYDSFRKLKQKSPSNNKHQTPPPPSNQQLTKSTDHLLNPLPPKPQKYNSLPSHNRIPSRRPQLTNPTHFPKPHHTKPPRPPSPSHSTHSTSTTGIYSTITPYPRVFTRYNKTTQPNRHDRNSSHEIYKSSSSDHPSAGRQQTTHRSYSKERTSHRRSSSVVVVSNKVMDDDDNDDQDRRSNCRRSRIGGGGQVESARCSSDDVSH